MGLSEFSETARRLTHSEVRLLDATRSLVRVDGYHTRLRFTNTDTEIVFVHQYYCLKIDGFRQA